MKNKENVIVDNFVRGALEYTAGESALLRSSLWPLGRWELYDISHEKCHWKEIVIARIIASKYDVSINLRILYNNKWALSDLVMIEANDVFWLQ